MIKLRTKKIENENRDFYVTYAWVEEGNQRETIISVAEWLGEKVEMRKYEKFLTMKEVDKKINKIINTMLKPKKPVKSWFR